MLKELRHSSFAKNVFVLFSGSLLAQLIPFFILPILQKYYFSPADFGIMALFITFFELFSRVATLKLEFGVVLQNRARDAINLAMAAIKASFYVAFLSLVFVALFHKQLGDLYEVPKYSMYFLLLPIYIILSGFTETANYWFNRKKKFKTIASAKVVQTAGSESSKLFFGVLNFSFIGLVVGRMIGFAMTTIYYLIRFWKSDKRALKLLDKKSQWTQLNANKKFIFYTTPSVFIGSLVNLTYINLFQFYYGEEIVGNISVSMLYLGTGFGVISLSFSQVFYSKLAEIHDRNTMLKMYIRFTKNLFLFAVLTVVAVFIFPESVVVYLLGDTWSELIHIARIMVVWLAIWFISSSLSFIYIRLGKQRTMVVLDIIHLFIIAGGFYLGRMLNDLHGALWGFALSQVLFYLSTMLLAIYFIKKSKILD